MKTCHSCREPWDGPPGTQPGRSETCSKCGADLHVCLNCLLYDPSSHNACRSRTTEPVKDKQKRNFCDEFEISSKGPGGGGPAKGDDMESKWRDMFK